MDNEEVRCRFCEKIFYKETSSSDYPEEFCCLMCQFLHEEEGSESQEEPYE